MVGSIGDVDEPLLLVQRIEGDLPGRARAVRIWRQDGLSNVRPVLLEYLDPVTRPIGHVDETVVGDGETVDRGPPGTAGRSGRIPGGWRLIRRRLAVGAPVALVRSRLGVEHDEAAVPIPVRDVELIRPFV